MFLHGSGKQENLWSFKQKTKNSKDARIFQLFNLKGQSAAFIVSPHRPTEDGTGGGGFGCGETELEKEAGDLASSCCAGAGQGRDGFGAPVAEVEIEHQVHEGDENFKADFKNSADDGDGAGHRDDWRTDFVDGVCDMDGYGTEETDIARSAGVDSLGKMHVNSSTACHLHAHEPSSAHLSGSFVCGGSSRVVLGAPGWAVGRWSARLSSRWCCPG